MFTAWYELNILTVIWVSFRLSWLELHTGSTYTVLGSWLTMIAPRLLLCMYLNDGRTNFGQAQRSETAARYALITNTIALCLHLHIRLRLRWSRGSVLAFGTQVRGSKPGRSCRIFQGEKILSTPSFGREVKSFVPCRRFTACKRSLNVTWKSGIFRQNSSAISRPSSSSFHY